MLLDSAGQSGYSHKTKMHIDEYEFFRSLCAKALMDKAGFTTLLERSLVSSESGRGERQLAPTCSVPRRHE